MSLSRTAPIFAALLLAGCGSHARVSASDCILHGDTLSVRVRNDADKPVVRVQLQADFYQNYRFTRAAGDKVFAPVLDPGTSRVVGIPIDFHSAANASPMKCTVSRAFYGDNTLEDF